HGLHPSRRGHTHPLGQTCLPALLYKNRHLPSAPRAEFHFARVSSIALVTELGGHVHFCHAHLRHASHKEANGYFCSGERLAIRCGEFYVYAVLAFVWRRWISGEFGRRLLLRPVHRCCSARRWRSVGAGCSLELAFRINQEVGRGRNRVTN